MRTYFVRHTEALDINDETRRRLWDEGRVAIHFPKDRNGKLPDSGDNTVMHPANLDTQGLGF